MAAPADHRMKMKGRKIIEKYWDITQELIKLLKMNAEVMPIIAGTFRSVSKRPRIKTGCHYEHLI